MAGVVLGVIGFVLLKNAWFNGHDTVGVILLILGGVVLLFEVFMWVLVGGVFRKTSRDINVSLFDERFPPPPPRRVRGRRMI